MSLLAIALGFGALLTLHGYQTGKSMSADAPIQPPSKVTVIFSAYNEAEHIEKTLTDMMQQNIVQVYPEMFEFIVVDNESTDNTAEIASKYAQVVSAPRGKLNAMMMGAESSSGDILYFCDVDVEAKPNFLNLILQHFNDPEVVAVSGCPYHYGFPTYLAEVVWSNVNATAKIKVNGASLAIRKDVFFQVGGFDTSINQFDRAAMQKEEEFNMAEKLKEAGTLIIDAEAAFFAEPRLQQCCNEYNPESPKCNYCIERAKGERF